jgi:hypothetical protein
MLIIKWSIELQRHMKILAQNWLKIIDYKSMGVILSCDSVTYV